MTTGAARGSPVAGEERRRPSNPAAISATNETGEGALRASRDLQLSQTIEVTGIVQGVGFRPFVHRLAVELGLSGHVGNDAAKVEIDVSGPAAAVESFVARLETEAPPLARIDTVSRRRTEPDASKLGAFRIVASRSSDGARTLVPPDAATCPDCLHDLFDPSNRRYRHAFVNCTNCGPRFTIIEQLPYDRPNTTMSSFSMCGPCRAEYEDARDRRFHAQPISCHECGPTLRLRRDELTPVVGDEAIAYALSILANGEVVALKGIGGYHLICDAMNSLAVTSLRSRKHRPDKPLAVMVADAAQAARLGVVGDRELEQLEATARPIVLMRAQTDSPVAPEVAPDNPLIGVVLPYSPIHHLLFADGAPPLVVTSANLGGEPLIHRDDDDAQDRLGTLADAILDHDRRIHVPCDDSVVRIVDGDLLMIRRGRGHAPMPVTLRDRGNPVLGVGGELKNTFCVGSGRHLWLSQHVGDMASPAALEAFESGVDQFQAMYDITPEVVAADAHPGYLTTRWAQSHAADEIMAVQHHHAHVAAVMAEHELPPDERVIGFAFDGTGFGPDGTVWGGEVLLADATDFERAAHLRTVALPGGDAAVQNPYRVALAHLAASSVPWTPDLAPVAQLDEVERDLLWRQLESGIGCVPTSSMGRLFDAVASLLDLQHRITYEAQAAIALEHVANRTTDMPGYEFAVEGADINAGTVIGQIVADVSAGIAVDHIARRFHQGVADMVFDVASMVSVTNGVHRVILSGGVFQNALLTRLCTTRLRRAGLEVLTARLVPPNDGGLALGQAYIAAHAPLRTN